MKKIPLTVVIITKNEEENIEKCLSSVYGWADEIIVVDDQSTDRTVEIASKYADKVLHRKMENEGIHRNWSYSQARNEWVLSLDADEYVSAELKEEISNLFPTPKCHAYSIPLRNFIGDVEVKYSGWYPAHKHRLFMKSKFKYEEVGVHPRIMGIGENLIGEKLHKDIIHKGYPDFAHFLQSLNRQTTLEAKKWIQTGKNMTFGKALWRAIDRFPRVFIGKKGYKDGFIGFMIAYFASLYQIISYAKYWEMKKKV